MGKQNQRHCQKSRSPTISPFNLQKLSLQKVKKEVNVSKLDGKFPNHSVNSPTLIQNLPTWEKNVQRLSSSNKKKKKNRRIKQSPGSQTLVRNSEKKKKSSAKWNFFWYVWHQNKVDTLLANVTLRLKICGLFSNIF